MVVVSSIPGCDGFARLWMCIACLSLWVLAGCSGHVEKRTADQLSGGVPVVATGEAGGAGGRSRDSHASAAIGSSQSDAPLPRWMCDETVQTAEPAWPGEYVPFSFEVCNLGDDDMLVVLQRR